METTSLNLQPPTTRLAFDGNVERVSYFNSETGQCLLEIKDALTNELIFISGKLALIYPGMNISGSIVSIDPESNICSSQKLTANLPNSQRNLKKFLRAEALQGIGPKLIKVLAESFPHNFFRMLEDSPNELLHISGIAKKKQSQILESWRDFQSRNELSSFLFSQNLPLSWASSLWLTYGRDSLKQLLDAPYEVGHQHHLPFDLIDSFALQRGFSLDSLERLRFGFKHVLWSFYKQGHCAYPEEKVFNEAQRLLETSKERLEEILEIEILDDQVIIDQIRGTNCLYFKEIWNLEKNVARQLRDFQFKEPSWGWFNSDKVLTWAQNILNIRLAVLQREAIETALTSSLTVITGGPGTGKTTLIRSLVTILQTQHLQFALCTPTGRAAQRLSEATNMPAQTIHRLLKYDGTTGQFVHNKKNPLKFDLVLIDEASMVDLQLFSDLLSALPQHCALILVGDADQIPSVGAGNILQSIISSPLFKVVRLSEIYRQSENSHIKKNAQRINAGQMPLMHGTQDFQYLPVYNVEQAKSVVRDLLEKTIPGKCGIQNLEEVQVLVPLNHGVMGAQIFNQEIQSRMRSGKSIALTCNEFGQNFKLGDKVMVLKNDYKKDVFNGDIGFVEKIDHERQIFEINFSGRNVHFGFHEMDRLTLAYAISIHKSQGSEYRAVIVVITEEHIPMAQRHLVYTAITRGKEYVFLVAEPLALHKALQEVEWRWEKLTERLQPH